MITREELEKLVDFEASKNLVSKTVDSVLLDSDLLLKFMHRYAAFNSYFGSNVAGLAGRIGRSGKFIDPEEPISCLADRSVLVGSYFFDAARDEFDDRDTAHRDTHRCLAQAFISGMINIIFPDRNPAKINEIVKTPWWFESLNGAVAEGYGDGHPLTNTDLFYSIGYHLGSEILADFEFTYIDEALHRERRKLVEYLKDHYVLISGQMHNAYSWISLHSTYNKGGAKEVEHFNWATQGANMALKYSSEVNRRYIHYGFKKFFTDHTYFFNTVLNG